MKVRLKTGLLLTIVGVVGFVLNTVLFIRPNTSQILILKTMHGKKAGVWGIPMDIIVKKMPGIIIQPNHWYIICWMVIFCWILVRMNMEKSRLLCRKDYYR